MWTDSLNSYYFGFACGALLSPLAFLCKSKKISLPLFSATFIVPSYLGQKLLYRYSQYREARADETIADNIHLLRAYKQCLKDNLFLFPKLWENHKIHPHPTVSSKRLKERIRKIKEKGDPKAFEDPLVFKEESEIK